MSEARVFGPILGAGVQLTEEAGQDSVEQGRLGSTVLVGPFERGLEDDITILPGKRALGRKMGGLLDPAEYDVMTFASVWTPLMAKHFWERSRGAGTLICLRVTPKTNDAVQDDRPSKSKILVWNRESTPVLLGQIDAHNGGAWAGKRKVYLGKISGTPGTDFPAANQIQLDGLAAKELQYDEFRNGTVYLDGLPSNSYKIVKNTPLGLITLEADQDVEGDWGSGETSGSETSDAETFNLQTITTAWTIGVTTETGGPDTATLTATAASLGGDGAGTFPLTQTGDMVIDVNGTEYTVSLSAGQTETQVIDAIEAAIPGIDVVSAASTLTINTDQKGTGATITLNDGSSTTAVVTEVFSTATPTETAGGGDVVNHFAATASEIATALTAAIGASGATAVAAGGFLTVTTGVPGSTGYVTMSGNLITLLGFDGLQHDGTDGPSDLDVTLVRSNLNYRNALKAVSIEIRDGALKPNEEFGMIVYVSGTKMLSYENLSMDDQKSNYWASVINDDPNNDIITVTDSFTGDRLQATARPANHYGDSRALTATRLTIMDPQYSGLTVGGDWVPTLTWNSWGADAKPQMLTVTMDNVTDFTVTTDAGNRSWSGSLAGAVDMEDYVGDMTITTSSGTPQAGDYFFVYLKPLAIDEAIGGRIFPNVEDTSQRNQNFEIIDNGVNWVDVSVLNDLTDGGANTAGKEYRIQYKAQMEQGYDGYLAGMSSSDYEQLLEEATSPLRKLKGRGYGLVKMGIPGIAYTTQAVALQQKLKYLAARYNWGNKIEIPDEFHDFTVYYEQDIVDWLTNTLTRGDDADYSSCHFPNYGFIRDPFAEAESDARNVEIPLMGMILGNEAYVAQEYQGYHKAPAGVRVSMPDIIELPVVGRPENPTPLDEEVLNPSGVNVVKWRNGGNYVIQWGDRTLSQNTAFRFYHKRCMMSQYEIDLLEGFDFTIFEINDPVEDANVLAVLHDYFLPEFRKRALRGDAFVGGQNPAAIFKMDAENNTNATRAQGDQIVEISLRLADTIERLRIFIGAMGVVEGTV